MASAATWELLPVGRDPKLREQNVPKSALTFDKMTIWTARNQDEAVVARRRSSEKVHAPPHTALP